MAIVDQESGIKFGRTSDKTRIPVFFEFSSDAVDDLPERYKYSQTDDQWNPLLIDGFTSNLLATTVASLGLTDAKYKSNSKGTTSNAKVWKVRVLTSVSTVEQNESGAPSGSPARYTTFGIPVPSWLTRFLFAHSVFDALVADSDVFISDGTNSPVVGQIVSFISPSGRSYSGKQIQGFRNVAEPAA